jgi:hypothetical protein
LIWKGHIYTQLIIKLITDSMELSSSREAASFAATEELPNILWSFKVYYHGYNSPPEPEQSNPFHPNLSL